MALLEHGSVTGIAYCGAQNRKDRLRARGEQHAKKRYQRKKSSCFFHDRSSIRFQSKKAPTEVSAKKHKLQSSPNESLCSAAYKMPLSLHGRNLHFYQIRHASTQKKSILLPCFWQEHPIRYSIKFVWHSYCTPFFCKKQAFSDIFR
jgi:hypothetical protein